MLDDIKVSDLINLVKAMEPKKSQDSLWKIGESYFIRTVTMYVVGRLKSVNQNEILMEEASWVADTGRFNNALKTGELSEVEPFVNDVIVNRTAIIDATVWTHKLPSDVI